MFFQVGFSHREVAGICQSDSIDVSSCKNLGGPLSHLEIEGAWVSFHDGPKVITGVPRRSQSSLSTSLGSLALKEKEQPAYPLALPQYGVWVSHLQTWGSLVRAAGWGTVMSSQPSTLWTLPTYSPLVFLPVSPVCALHSQCSGITHKVSAAALFVYILLFIHKTCLCEAPVLDENVSFQSPLTCSPSENPSSLPHRKLTLLPPPLSSHSPLVTCLSSECSILPTCFSVPASPSRTDWRQTHVKSPQNPMPSAGTGFASVLSAQ